MGWHKVAWVRSFDLRLSVTIPAIFYSQSSFIRAIDSGAPALPSRQNIKIKKKEYVMLIKIQPDATVCRYLFTTKSLYMFRVSQHPSSGVLKTVTAASGTATSLQRGLISPRWREVAVPVLWPVPEVAVTVFSTPYDGCCDTRNMKSDFAVNKYLHTVASGWIFINIELWCKEIWALKKKQYVFVFTIF